MAYCAQSDLSERFGDTELAQLTDPAAQTPQPSEIAFAIEEASSLIDTYVFVRYTVPLLPVPTIVRKWACDIARKFLWKDRAGADSVVTANYDAAIAMLKDVAKGIASLPEAAGESPEDSGFAVSVVAPPEIFTPDVLNRAPGGPYSGSPAWETMLP